MPPSTKGLNHASKILTTQKQKDNVSSPFSQKTSQIFPTQMIRNPVSKRCTEKTSKAVCHPPDYCPNYTRISNGPRVLMLPHLWWSISVKTLTMTTKRSVFFWGQVSGKLQNHRNSSKREKWLLKKHYLSPPPPMSICLNIKQTGLTHNHQGNWKSLLSSLLASVFTYDSSSSKNHARKAKQHGVLNSQIWSSPPGEAAEFGYRSHNPPLLKGWFELL